MFTTLVVNITTCCVLFTTVPQISLLSFYSAWFLKELSPPTSDDIEMRVCRDESRANEDIAMSSVEIYVECM